jgi:hypothetical protein
MSPDEGRETSLVAVWYVCPSARKFEEAEAALSKWRTMGYKLAVFREEARGPVKADILVNTLPYTGYAITANLLISLALAEDSECEWVVVGADDIHPDPNHSPEEIADHCSEYFDDKHLVRCEDGDNFYRSMTANQAQTFGVMQPTGDRWGERPPGECHDFIRRPPSAPMADRCMMCGREEGDSMHLGGAYSDRVAYSPWIGRQFAKRMYHGKGPYWPEYTHCGVDEELQFVAQKYGVFWQRRDLIQYHDHWGRPRMQERMGQADRMPAFLKKANSPEEWQRYKQIFNMRKSLGFPGSEPL